MSYLTTIALLYRHLRKGLYWAHHACKIATHINTAIQGSNASDALKTQAANFLTSANALCDAIAAYIAGLPGN